MMFGGDFSYLNKRYGGGRVAEKTGQKGKDARDVLELEDLLLPGYEGQRRSGIKMPGPQKQ